MESRVATPVRLDPDRREKTIRLQGKPAQFHSLPVRRGKAPHLTSGGRAAATGVLGQRFYRFSENTSVSCEFLPLQSSNDKGKSDFP